MVLEHIFDSRAPERALVYELRRETAAGAWTLRRGIG
jgi:hypothetical protein